MTVSSIQDVIDQTIAKSRESGQRGYHGLYRNEKEVQKILAMVDGERADVKIYGKKELINCFFVDTNFGGVDVVFKGLINYSEKPIIIFFDSQQYNKFFSIFYTTNLHYEIVEKDPIKQIPNRVTVKQQIRKNEEKQMNTTTQAPQFNMSAFGEDFQFDTSKIVMSMMGGLAVQIGNKALSYRRNKIQDVTGFTFPMPGMAFIVPVVKVKEKDMIISDGKVLIVKAVTADGLSCVNLESGTLETILPKTNIMNMAFYAKVVSMIGEGKSFGKMLPMMMFMQGGMFGQPTTDGTSPQNPMMMAMMMSQFTGEGGLDFSEMFDFDLDEE